MVEQFYDTLAASYHLLFDDWQQSIERQGNALERLLVAHETGPPRSLLDCSCGIGTQAIGLAQRGYTVHATDISAEAVQRAAAEAARQNVTITTGVADLRDLAASVTETFDVVLSCDNALPHLLSDEELHQAAHHMRARLNADGLLLASIRDYDHLTIERPRATMPRVFDGGLRIVFQTWDWAADDQTYTLNLFILRSSGETWHTQQFATTYRALLRHELTAILQAHDFADVRWHMPQDTGYYQPIVTARPT